MQTQTASLARAASLCIFVSDSLPVVGEAVGLLVGEAVGLVVGKAVGPTYTMRDTKFHLALNPRRKHVLDLTLL